MSRGGHDRTEDFKRIIPFLNDALHGKKCVLDGELVRLTSQGHPDGFPLVHKPVVYWVFDVLEVRGQELLDLPFQERRERLERLLSFNDKVRLVEQYTDGPHLFAAVVMNGLEWVVAKRLGSRYIEGPSRRSGEWLKKKVKEEAEAGTHSRSRRA
jgi:bifunctional non-homologous end joining protein LigD